MNKPKKKNQKQTKTGTDIAPLLAGKVSFGSLRKIHIPLVRKEIEVRSGELQDTKLGIRKLTSILRKHESSIAGVNDVNEFLPRFRVAADWDQNNVVTFT